MATVIDTLVLQLGLDPKQFLQGEKEVDDAVTKTRTKTTKAVKEIGDGVEAAAMQFGQLQIKVVGAITAFLGLTSAGRILTDTVTTLSALGRMTQTTGAVTKDVDAFAKAIERNGGSAAAATEEVTGLIKAMQDWKSLGEASPGLQMFAGTIGARETDTWLDLYKRFADFAEKNKDNPSFVAQIGGKGGLSQQTISELMKGRGGFEADLERSRQIGVATEDQIKASRELQESFAALGQTVDNFTRQIVTEFEPAIKAATDFMATWVADKRGPEGAGKGAIAGAIVGFFLGGPVGAAEGAAIGASLGALVGGAATIGKKLDTPEIEEGAKYDPLTGMPYPGATLKSPKPKATPAPDQAPSIEDDIKKLTSMGWSRPQATALVANLWRESGGKIDAVGDNGKAYGLAQWHPDRQANFAKWSGHDIRSSTREEQLAFLNDELRYGAERKAGAALSAAKDAAEAAKIVSKNYERPAGGDTEASVRAFFASELWRGYAVGNLPVPTAAETAQINNSRNETSTSTATTTVAINGPITIHTQATDAAGIAGAFANELQEQGIFTSQANVGQR